MMNQVDLNTNRIASATLEKSKNWAEFTVDRILEKFPDLDLYTCAAGISPSGVVHFGNFRDIMTSLSIVNELKKRGKKARLLFSWDNFDRFRKVPKNFDLEKYVPFIGLPLTAVPDPTGETESYARKAEIEFETTMQILGVELEYRYQTQCYTSGMYKEQIIKALQNKSRIAEIIYGFMSEKARTEKFESYAAFEADFWPIAVYSKFNNKDNTRILSFDGVSKVTYFCTDTNQEAELDFNTDTNAKLSWKIDWPMRWQFEGVVFEPGGKDHATPGGSYDVSAVIAKEIFGYESPIFVGYDFVGITGLEGKMSSSAGNAMSPAELLQVYTVDLLKFTYEKTPPQRTFNLSFGPEIYRQYDDLDKTQPELNSIPFKHAVAYGQIVNWNPNKLVELLRGIDLEYNNKSILERLPCAKNWLEKYNPDEMFKLLDTRNESYYSDLSELEKSQIANLVEYIKTDSCESIEAINLKVYGIPKDTSLTEQENKKLQRNFFSHIYFLLFNKNTGPRLATYIWAVEKSELIKLLDFA